MNLFSKKVIVLLLLTFTFICQPLLAEEKLPSHAIKNILRPKRNMIEQRSFDNAKDTKKQLDLLITEIAILTDSLSSAEITLKSYTQAFPSQEVLKGLPEGAEIISYAQDLKNKIEAVKKLKQRTYKDIKKRTQKEIEFNKTAIKNAKIHKRKHAFKSIISRINIWLPITRKALSSFSQSSEKSEVEKMTSDFNKIHKEANRKIKAIKKLEKLRLANARFPKNLSSKVDKSVLAVKNSLKLKF